jgi:hypothetical protein
MATYSSPFLEAQQRLLKLQAQRPSNVQSDEFTDWLEMYTQAQQEMNALEGQASGQIDISGGVDPILSQIRSDLAAWGGAPNIVSAIDQGAPLGTVVDALQQLRTTTSSGANTAALDPILNFAEVAAADFRGTGVVTGTADPLQNIKYSLMASGEAPDIVNAINSGATLAQVMPALIDYRWTTTNPKNVGKLDPLLGAGWYALAAENAAAGLPPPAPLPTFPGHQGTWQAVGTAFTDYILPAALAMTPIGPVAGAALGSALGSTIQERDFEDALLRAALSAGTAYAGSAIMGVNPWGQLGEVGAGTVGAGTAGAGTAGAGTAGAGTVGAGMVATPGVNEVLVSASLLPQVTAAQGALLGGAGTALAPRNPIIPRPKPDPYADITTTTITAPFATTLSPSAVLGAAGAGAGLATATGGTAPQTPKPPSEGGGVKEGPGTSISDIIDYIGFGAKGLSLLGALGVGGTGAGGAGGGGGMLAPPSLPPGYGYGTGPGTLPTITTGPGAPSAARPVNMSMDDWLTYATRPEASFFTDVPMRAAAGGMAVRRPPKPSFAVRGKGDGRSDEIPALLSDGEYVIDAETVALLGNGSGKAGAEALDRFRANVRRHKGRELSKGRFSVNAKKPEKYLTGGRT